MSENENTHQGPTQKMADFATSIAKRLNLELPLDVMVDFDACKQFIDANIDAANAIPNPPSEKQVKFATSIATKKGLTIPAEALAQGKELSKWIDANKD